MKYTTLPTPFNLAPIVIKLICLHSVHYVLNVSYCVFIVCLCTVQTKTNFFPLHAKDRQSRVFYSTLFLFCSVLTSYICDINIKLFMCLWTSRALSLLHHWSKRTITLCDPRASLLIVDFPPLCRSVPSHAMTMRLLQLDTAMNAVHPLHSQFLHKHSNPITYYRELLESFSTTRMIEEGKTRCICKTVCLPILAVNHY